MAEIVWTNPALDQLDEIAEYIALDKPQAASRLVKEIFSTVERLERFPDSGHVPSELPNSIYRELYVRPCRIFYRRDGNRVFIVHVMREERQLRQFLLDGESDG
ncbi:type II toxin-antitoxin system RelE/ParE family toxin [Geoalkalibacter halelectricus]|uniref:Type II toxin-antitoxin system RelE/ParE family toxin n=1 Tax=Geoalkalibacter halelectricus TaxID=2847045 RepID=A0ABY5ZMZ9_9BACT|nr:type II toxin-antitoxin system RelE/ParE family toxin [Geoalkalibacter halelectricus]MDO3376851.1 type II toxin-antitoxin system RelE/ParE family toxin [Geoalkalibacter halelectricus]UWZ79084.1 type II toxin-antitoxin system RelE/ParE family toxin [Geoalkalibacter halelectricus]